MNDSVWRFLIQNNLAFLVAHLCLQILAIKGSFHYVKNVQSNGIRMRHRLLFTIIFIGFWGLYYPIWAAEKEVFRQVYLLSEGLFRGGVEFLMCIWFWWALSDFPSIKKILGPPSDSRITSPNEQ